MPIEYQTPAIEDRAVEIQIQLADRGRHRAPSVPDLIVAATAEFAGLTVLHFDKEFRSDRGDHRTVHGTSRLGMRASLTGVTVT